MEWKHKAIILSGMWLASLVGSVYGLLFTIIGAGFDWGPGGDMEGPYWKILIVGLISILIGMYVGEAIVRKLGNKVHKNPRSKGEISLLMFLTVTVASLLAWVLSWEAGFITGILMGCITWDDPLKWSEVVFNVAIMSAVFGVPISLAAGLINTLIANFVIKKNF